MTLDYRNPQTAPQRLDHILQRIRQQEAWLTTKIFCMFAGGAMLSFVGPWLAANMVFAISARIPGDWHLGWWTVFALCCIIVIPLLFWTEWRTRGQFYLDEIGAQNPRGSGTELECMRPSSGDWHARAAAAMSAAFVEVLLFAPRMVLDAVRQRAVRRRLGQIDLVRAAEIVAALANTTEGVDPLSLARPDDSPQQLYRTLRLLELHDWVGVSKTGDRVWLFSDARKRLGA